MRKFLLSVAVLLTAWGSGGAENPAAALDAALEKGWKSHDLAVPKPASDEVFVRRIYLDAAGVPPTADEAREFLADKSPDKRAKLIDRLLASDRFAKVLAMRYADMFRIKSEFPINLWPNAVQLYYRYFYDAARTDRPWNKVVRELLTSSGSNFRVAPANFFRANGDRSPEGLARGTALSLMGFGTARLSKEEQKEFARFFSRIRFKKTREWKEEIVYTDPEPAGVKARFPGGGTVTMDAPETDPRVVFADWLLDPDNPWFACAYVNRAWSWVFGRGVAEPADDLPVPPGFWGRIGNALSGSSNLPGANPELMQALIEEFRRSGYRPKALFRAIFRSKAYQADWKCPPEKWNAAAEQFAVYPVRRLEAELLADALAQLTGQYESFSSVIPEPFTFLPKKTPAVEIADGSISSAVLDNFGRPPRDSGALSERVNAITAAQRLWLMNSGTLYRALNRTPGRLFRKKRLNWERRCDEIYLATLSRYPSPEEVAGIKRYYDSLPRKQRWNVWSDLLWALVNGKEFLYHH